MVSIWDLLLVIFPSLFSFVHLMYGEAADMFFFEDQYGFDKIVSEVGLRSRQGCSLGYFLYCLAIHPVLQQLKEDYKDLDILACRVKVVKKWNSAGNLLTK